MNAREAITIALQGTGGMLPMYLGDLSDADFLVRPAPSANHIAWQLGHLIASEAQLIKGQVSTAVYPEMPAGFDKQHGKETSAVEPPKGFATKADYLSLFAKVREATVANLQKLSDADLDKTTTGPMAAYAPNVGAMFLLVSNHTLMHAGQFTVVRRKLGKPVLF